MKVLTASKDDCFIVRVSGDIDHHTASGIRERIDSDIDLNKPKQLILDLSQTDFMDSSGLGLILGRMRKTKEKDIEFTVLNPSESVMKILRLSGADKMLDIKNV